MSNLYYAIESRFDYEGQPYESEEVSAEELTPPTHEALYNFLRYDLSALDSAMNEFLGVLNVETLEIDEKGKKNKLQKVYDTLKEVHPYYSFGGSACYETNDAVRRCLNLLLYANGHGKERLLSEKKYLEVLGNLSSHEFKFYGEDYLDGFYQDYVRFNPDAIDCESNTAGYTFQKILNAKRNTQMMLFWIFDFSVPELSHLTVYQRAHLYDCVFKGKYSPVLEIKKTINFGASECVCGTAALDFGDENDVTAIHRLHNNNYFFGADDAVSFPEVMTGLIHDVQQITGSPIREVCEIGSLEQLLSFELVNMLDQNIIVKRCKYCGNYFIAENLKNDYCTGYAPNEKRPCSEIGSARTYQNRVKKDEIYTLYQRAYKTHFARIKKGKMNQTEFYTWALEGKQKMSDAREGKLPMEDYAAWLKI